jgi:hypothetical protein
VGDLKPVPGIFISYRRGDSIGHTGRLFDLLSKHFGPGQVFMDIDTIGPGEDYMEVIKRTTESCQVLLAVIGRGWLNAVDEHGNRRLDDPADFVRLEIGDVLEKGARVVPVLVDGARMPDAKSLPDDLKKLALRNACEINDKNFHHDVKQLIEALQKMQPALQPAVSQSGIERSRQTAPGTGAAAAMGHGAMAGQPGQDAQRADMMRKGIYVGIGAVVLMVLGLIGFFEWVKSTPPKVAQTGSSSGTDDIPSLQASVTAPPLFFLADPNRPVPPLGQRTYATNFHTTVTSGKRIFWEIALNFQGQFPPQDYQIQSVWYCDSKEVYRGTGNYKGSEISTRAFHNRFGWDPPGGNLAVGQYRVDLFVAGQKITSGSFVVQQ